MTSFAEGLVGVVLDGRYRLDAVVGEGGMGAVFRAQHLATERRVAVKLLKPHLSHDQTALERFAREARSTLKVESPHAVKVLDFGVTPHGDYYMALEYLDGRTVHRELEVDGPFAPSRAIHVARHCLHALAAAHARGLVHRDLKPDNILLMRVDDDPDFAKVLDFGVAKLMEGTARSSRSALKLTQAGMVFGTPEYMSPEQAVGETLDGRSDLYSLAATLFTMLTGELMFRANSPIEWLSHHVRTRPPRLADVAPNLAHATELDAVLQQCLAKRRGDRPATADELDALLARIAGDPGARPPEIAATVDAVDREPRPRHLTATSPSTFVEAYPASGDAIPSTDELIAPARRTGRAVVALTMGVVVAGIAVAVVAARSDHGETPEAAPAHAAIGPATTPDDAGPPVERRVDEARAIAPLRPDGPDRVAPADARPRLESRVDARSDGRINAHLEAAEAAHRAGNRLRQLAEADLAVQLEPKNVRAIYLLADALIQGGDLEGGCARLRGLGRVRAAVARRKSAGCPID